MFDPSTLPNIYGGQGRFTGSSDVPLPNQIAMESYPNYRDQSVVNEALRVGKRVADASNEEKRINANNIAANNRREGFIESLLGDIDFKSLAKSPLVMQALQGLSRMPTNQRQFGDSMLTGFTRGMQQFGAEEQARDQLQIARDVEAAKAAENLRRYELDRTDKIEAGDKKRENDLRIALIKNSKSTQTKGTNPSEKTLQDINDYLDDDKFEAVLDNASSEQIGNDNSSSRFVFSK